MSEETAPDPRLAERFRLRDAKLVAETPIARVWKATGPDGAPAALKVWRDPARGNEAAGLDCLALWDGRGAVRLLDRSENAALMEWAPGPPLGDLFRTGDWRAADAALVEVTLRFHRLATPPPAGVPALRPWLSAIFEAAAPGDWPAPAQETFRAAQARADALLAAAPAPMLLHGDIHHDNIAGSPRGWLAFDPKGVMGEPAYDFANAFRNPRGGGADVIARDRVETLAGAAADGVAVSRARIFSWAAAKAAISLVWARQWRIDEAAPALGMIETFLALADEHGWEREVRR